MTDKKVALVTGSGKRRIGSFVVEALAARGYALAIHYRTSRAEAERTVADYHKQGIDAWAVQADLSRSEGVTSLITGTQQHFGRLDVLVHCASSYPREKLEDITAASLQACFDTNALGAFLCAQQAGLLMTRQAEGGNIILFGDWATRRPYLDFAGYLAAKGSIPTMMRCLAVELATRNPSVRVNCILPGPVLFPPDMPAEERQAAIASTLVKRQGTPENIAQAVLFLLDNDFVTGACLPIDGGRSVYAPE